VHVDEAGQQRPAARVDYLASRALLRFAGRLDRGDAAVADDDVARAVEQSPSGASKTRAFRITSERDT
jgi:hypothetical protein